MYPSLSLARRYTAIRAIRYLLLPVFLLVGCDANETIPEPIEPEVSENCIIATQEFANSTGIDAIPALVDPNLVTADEATYLRNSDLVLGLQNGDFIVAIPHNILWWHEIVNFSNTSPQLAVTFCPLTGSGLAFDRSRVNNLDFGVSGLLWRNNNVIFDRSEDTFSLWSQMGSVALCSSEGNPGKRLPPYPLVEMTWGGWKDLYPETFVVSESTGFSRNYEINPLGSYTEPDNTTLFWPMPGPADDRRLPKERILGLPDEKGGLSIPLDELEKSGHHAVLHVQYKNQPAVIFFDAGRASAWAFWLDGTHVDRNFAVQENRIVDTATETTWRVDGTAVDGPLAGAKLTPVAEAYVSYWFAWSVFQPEAILWRTDG
ncbi:MAG: DUF3179 domain-containing protein [Bacteroidota bacterium]